MAEWSYDRQSPMKLAKIIEDVEKGRIALPEFQRGFDWSPARVVSLLASVARRWPIGNLLIITSDRLTELGWGTRSLVDAPDLDAARILVLDGQQRLTSLYHAICDKSEDVYYCRIEEVESSGDLDDDHIVSTRRTKFVKEFPDVGSEASSGVIKVSRIFSDSSFDEWLGYMPRKARTRYHEVRNGPLGGLRAEGYEIPAERLGGEPPLPMIARIFETINRGALILSAFDLMVARLYPSNFNLREKWNEAKDEHSFPDSMDGLEALRIIALREHLRGDKDVKGIRQSDVLEVKAEQVIRNWTNAVEALARAIKFLRVQCGVVLGSLTPADAMLIPLADALWEGDASAERGKHLARWFWASTVSQTYAQGANTQAVSDAKELRAWADSSNAIPAIVANGVPATLADSLRDTRRRNRMLTRGVLCLIVCQDGRDWKTGERLAEIAPEKTIDAHHVFPDKYVKTSWEQEANIVANFTPLLGPSNRSLRNDVPSAVLRRSDVRNDHIWGHLIDNKAYQSDDWPGFLEARVAALTEAFRHELEN